MKVETKFVLAAVFILVLITTPIWSISADTKQSRFSVIASIGIETAQEEKEKPYQFSSILSADFDAEGKIYVLDYRDVCVKVFTKKGEFIRKFLKPGQGPDEVMNPYRIKINKAKKHVFVLHQNGFQIKEFDEAGNFVRSHPLPRQMYGYFDFIDENRLLFVDDRKYGEKAYHNFKIFNLDAHKIEKEFAPTTTDYFTSFQRIVIKDRTVWTCPGDLMVLEAFDLETGKKLKTIPLSEKYIPYNIFRSGNIQKIRCWNYAEPFLLGEDLHVFVIRQSFAKEFSDMLDSPLERDVKLYRLAGARLVEDQGFPRFDFFPEFLASWENKILISSSGYDLYPRLKVLEIR
jgi:hypothetical protein